LYHYTIARLFGTVVVRIMKTGEDVAARTRLRRKLNEERGEEVALVLLIKVPEVEVKVHYQGRPGLA
jgi:hypothetical protein